MKAEQNEYYLDRVMNFPNAVVRVYRPSIDEEERSRRMRIFEKSVSDLLKATIRQ